MVRQYAVTLLISLILSWPWRGVLSFLLKWYCIITCHFFKITHLIFRNLSKHCCMDLSVHVQVKTLPFMKQNAVRRENQMAEVWITVSLHFMKLCWDTAFHWPFKRDLVIHFPSEHELLQFGRCKGLRFSTLIVIDLMFTKTLSCEPWI